MLEGASTSRLRPAQVRCSSRCSGLLFITGALGTNKPAVPSKDLVFLEQLPGQAWPEGREMCEQS